MSNPAKVLGFLNLFGDWDPSLGLVMAAMLVGMLVRGRPSLLRSASNLRDAKRLNR